MASDPSNTVTVSDVLQVGSAPSKADEPEHRSYGEILRSSVLIGGSSLVTVAVGVVRTKAMALMLGPSGFGLLGLYGSVIDLAVSMASLGVNNSGVRQIAESVGTEDHARIARTVTVLRRITILLGTVGGLLLIALSVPVAHLTFGDAAHAGAIALLSLAVLFRVISAGQGALLQGMRRIGDLAAMGAIGALLGTVLSVLLVYAFGERGLVPSVIATAVVGALISWWYSRRIRMQATVMNRAEVGQEVSALLKLGFAFMASGILMMGASFAVRAIVLRMEGMEAAGFYLAAWTLGGLYAGIILQAMGSDFYPRLVAAAQNHGRCNRLVNEQTLVSLLLAGPGVIATITFAPLVLMALYSSEFSGAVEVLRWICLGIAMRVITWPIGFIIIAKNRQGLFLLTDFLWTVANLGLTWICVRAFGVSGAGIAFLGAYLFHAAMVYPIVRRLTGFVWSPQNRRTGAIFVISITSVFVGLHVLPVPYAYALGTVVVFVMGFHSIRSLAALSDWDGFPRPLKRILSACRLTPARGV